MQYAEVLFFLFLGIAVIGLFFMKRQEKVKPEKNQEEMRERLWELSNTIYLYAALSEEEAKTSSLKKKQMEILRNSEEMIRLLEK